MQERKELIQNITKQCKEAIEKAKSEGKSNAEVRVDIGVSDAILAEVNRNLVRQGGYPFAIYVDFDTKQKKLSMDWYVSQCYDRLDEDSEVVTHGMVEELFYQCKLAAEEAEKEGKTNATVPANDAIADSDLAAVMEKLNQIGYPGHITSGDADHKFIVMDWYLRRIYDQGNNK